MNLDDEWRIKVNIALRRVNAGIDDIGDRTIIEVNKVLNGLNTQNESLDRLAKAFAGTKAQ